MKHLQAALYLCLCAGPSFADTFLVLPFFNNEKASNLDWIGESISEAIRESLASEGVLTLDRDAREEGFRRLSMRPYSPLTRASVIRLAESLDADQVIFGSYDVLAPADKASKGAIRINAHAVDLKNARKGPDYSESGPLAELARLQTHLAWQVLGYVAPERRPTEEQFGERLPVTRVDAIESYIRGLVAPAQDAKLKYFTQAVRLEPKYSNANFELGRLQYQKKAYRPAADALQRVPPANVHYREALFLLGLSRYYVGDFAAAEQAFQTVAAQVPLNEVWNNLGAAQSRLHHAAALDNFRKALEGDASDPVYHFNVGYALLMLGDTNAAADRFREVLERNPGDVEATTLLARCLKPMPSKGPPRSEGVERLKQNYEESAYWQLKAVLEPKR
jgi:tetratricopeptide (TPR) repeat protein